MQSDERVTKALEILRGPIDQYRAAISGTRAQMADYLALHRGETDSRAHVAATALGRFAGGRVDATRFAAAFEGARALTAQDTSRIEECIATLDALTMDGDSLFTCHVALGGNFEDAVDTAFATLGRAFAAALVFQAVKTQVFRENIHQQLLDAFPFERWNRLERLVAPPLIVTVDANDIDVARIARFLDGRSRIVLMIRGAMAPAALVSLITPGVTVIQTTDAGDVAKMLNARGPAIVAVADETVARFVHDPAGGPRLADRLSIQAIPSDVPQRPFGRYSAFQQREQRTQLDTLVAACRAELQLGAANAMEAATAVAATAANGRAPAEAVDTLAGWLLTQAGLTEQSAR